MESNDALVEHLRRAVNIDERLAQAFIKADRKQFMTETHAHHAYDDNAFPLLAGQTISQPRTVAFMLKLLDVRPGMHVLDVGTGSGWAAALLRELVGSDGTVVGVERIPELLQYAGDRLPEDVIVHQAGEALGWSDDAPYDRILVSAAAEWLPEVLVEQLAPGGIMVIPIGDELWCVEKDGDDLAVDRYGRFSFVPLVTDGMTR